MPDFGELGLSEEVLRSLQEMGFEEPTPVQARAIPALIAGRDVVAQALTGTGKTAAYGIPLVERIDPSSNTIQAVVLAPTRELAVQVAEQLAHLGHHRGMRLIAIYGGQPYDRQLRALQRGVHALVATPGRMLDHLRRGSAKLDGVTMLILDEADQMLDMGFQEDVEAIMAFLPSERVSALFSATIPAPIRDLVKRYLREPETIRLSEEHALTAPNIEQVFYQVPFPRKLDALCRVLDARQPERAIVFCATKRMVDEAVERLQAGGYGAEALHGDISQPNREKVLRGFREGVTDVLVATDVAARGLDVPEVDLVINFDLPPDPDYYVHRIGRTGRLGRTGEAITFINPRELRALKLIERATGAHIRPAEVPSAAEVEARDLQVLEERLLDTIGRGSWGRYRAVIEDLIAEHDPLDLAAAALALVAATPRRHLRRARVHLERKSEIASAVYQPAQAPPVVRFASRSPDGRQGQPARPRPPRDRSAGPPPRRPSNGRPFRSRAAAPPSKRPR